MHHSRLSVATRNAAIRMALPYLPRRIVMKGSSMLPDVREGMVLDVVPLVGIPRVGDIVVFRTHARLVAHRCVGVRTDGALCAGDAEPECVDRVGWGEVAGVVEAVHDGARRVDTPAFHLRARFRARSRAVRATLCRTLPHLRVRSYATLVTIMAAVTRHDGATLRESLRSIAPWRLAAIARRHRCAVALSAALEELSGDEYAAAVYAHLRKDCWSVALRVKKLRQQSLDVARILERAGIPCVLLKGAQRLVCAVQEAECYDSQDIDVLVEVDRVSDACNALREAGYAERCEAGTLNYHLHHHAAPLFRQSAVPVEIHRALWARPLNLPTSFDELRPYLVPVTALGTKTYVLDAVGTAVALTVHCLQRPALRELLLLAQQLRRLDAVDTARLRRVIAREQEADVPLNAALLMAARLANLDWHTDALSERYAAWMLLREDLPFPLRLRPQCVDAWLAARHDRARAVFAAAFFEDSYGSPLRRVTRAVARLGAAIGIALYGAFMRSPSRVS